MPPALLLMALRMVLAELAPFNTLLTLFAGVAVWHIAQLAVYTTLPLAADTEGAGAGAGTGAGGGGGAGRKSGGPQRSVDESIHAASFCGTAPKRLPFLREDQPNKAHFADEKP